MNTKKFINELYGSAVDAKDVNYLSRFLADDVRFRIGNNNSIYGKSRVLEANQEFFNSIAGMAHKIDDIWEQGNNIICNGLVNYTRLDGSRHWAFFATVLEVDENKVVDYLVYVDLSQL